MVMLEGKCLSLKLFLKFIGKMINVNFFQNLICYRFIIDPLKKRKFHKQKPKRTECTNVNSYLLFII